MKKNEITFENLVDCKIIILDTNFILLPIQFRIDIFEDITNLIEGKFKILVLNEIIMELNDKIEREDKLKFKIQARRGLELLNLKKQCQKNKLSLPSTLLI